MALVPRSTSRPLRAAAAAVGAGVLLALLATSSPAGADEAPTPATLAEVMSGSIAGVTAEAVVDPDDPDMAIEVRFENSGDGPVEVAVPFGTLVVTSDEGDQTLAVNPPEDPDVVEVAARGGTPTIEVPTGGSEQTLPVYCTELGDAYPSVDTAVTPIEPASDELVTVLRAGVVEQASHHELQSAVWWLTDEPVLPVTGPEAVLLRDVDVEGFAAAPHRVIPDTGYTPMWMRDEAGPGVLPADEPPPVDDEEAAAILDESFDGPASPVGSTGGGGGSAATWLWVLLVAGAVVGIMIATTRAATRDRTRKIEVGHAAPGWYPDPWSSGRRYWDGRTWTDRIA